MWIYYLVTVVCCTAVCGLIAGGLGIAIGSSVSGMVAIIYEFATEE